MPGGPEFPAVGVHSDRRGQGHEGSCLFLTGCGDRKIERVISARMLRLLHQRFTVIQHLLAALADKCLEADNIAIAPELETECLAGVNR